MTTQMTLLKWAGGMCFATFMLLAQNISAQNAAEILVGHTFISNTGYTCMETAEPDPCAGLQAYLILEFSNDEVVVTEMEISGCNVEYIRSETNNKWSVKNKVAIVIDVETSEMEYAFIKDLTLKIEDGTLVGYKKINSETPQKFTFEENLIVE